MNANIAKTARKLLDNLLEAPTKRTQSLPRANTDDINVTHNNRITAIFNSYLRGGKLPELKNQANRAWNTGENELDVWCWQQARSATEAWEAQYGPLTDPTAEVAEDELSEMFHDLIGP
jgi:hypothetical protein